VKESIPENGLQRANGSKAFIHNRLLHPISDLRFPVFHPFYIL